MLLSVAIGVFASMEVIQEEIIHFIFECFFGEDKAFLIFGYKDFALFPKKLWPNFVTPPKIFSSIVLR